MLTSSTSDDRSDQDSTEAKKIKKSSNKFTLIDGELYRFGLHTLFLYAYMERNARGLWLSSIRGFCGSHIGGRSLATRTVRVGYYWPTMREDCKRYAQRCKQCQQHADWHKAPPEDVCPALHPQTNGQVESANRVLLRGLKRRLEKAKGSWAEEVPCIVWAYHTTEQSGTHETPFSLVYGCDAMIPIEIQESSPRF